MIRLFVALDLPAALREAVAALAGGIPGARWTPPETYHLTLRFIGEVEPWRAEEIDAALAAIRARPVALALRGVGTHEKAGRIQGLWVGAERTEALAHLQAKVETALRRAGLEPERRRFAPHVTLARAGAAAQERLVEFVLAHSLFRAEAGAIDRFVLFSSRLGRDHAVYEPEVEYALA